MVFIIIYFLPRFLDVQTSPYLPHIATRFALRPVQNLLADLNPEAHEFGKKVMADKKEIEAGTIATMLMKMLPAFF